MQLLLDFCRRCLNRVEVGNVDWLADDLTQTDAWIRLPHREADLRLDGIRRPSERFALFFGDQALSGSRNWRNLYHVVQLRAALFTRRLKSLVNLVPVLHDFDFLFFESFLNHICIMS